MQDLNLFSVFIDKLNEYNMDYFITGSAVSIIYGEPRLTHDVDLVISLLWSLQNKIEIEFLNRKIFIAPPEYVIIKKLEFYREGKSNKHIIDIRNMISISEERIKLKN